MPPAPLATRLTRLHLCVHATARLHLVAATATPRNCAAVQPRCPDGCHHRRRLLRHSTHDCVAVGWLAHMLQAALVGLHAHVPGSARQGGHCGWLPLCCGVPGAGAHQWYCCSQQQAQSRQARDAVVTRRDPPSPCCHAGMCHRCADPSALPLVTWMPSKMIPGRAAARAASCAAAAAPSTPQRSWPTFTSTSTPTCRTGRRGTQPGSVLSQPPVPLDCSLT